MPEEVFARAVLTDIMGSKVSVVALEDFLAMKIFAGGQKDVDDVRGVLVVSGEKIDFDLLKKLTSGYGQACVKTLNKILKNR